MCGCRDFDKWRPFDALICWELPSLNQKCTETVTVCVYRDRDIYNINIETLVSGGWPLMLGVLADWSCALKVAASQEGGVTLRVRLKITQQ